MIWIFLHHLASSWREVLRVICIIVGNLSRKNRFDPGGRVPGVFGYHEGREKVYFSLVSPLDQTNEKKYKPYFLVKEVHDVIYLIDLQAAQESLVFFQTANVSVSCYHTVPAVFFELITKLKDGSLKFVNNDTNGYQPKNRKTLSQQRKYYVGYWNVSYIHCTIDSTAGGQSLYFGWSDKDKSHFEAKSTMTIPAARLMFDATCVARTAET